MSQREDLIAALRQELASLEEAVALEPAPGTQPAHHALATLRASLPALAAAAAREAQRFALVCATGGLANDESARAVCASLGGAAERLVALVQAVADDVARRGAAGPAPAAAGDAAAGDAAAGDAAGDAAAAVAAAAAAAAAAAPSAAPTALRALCPGRALLREVRSASRDLVGALGALAEASADAGAVVRHAGRVGVLSEGFARLPTTPVAAVRRALLQTARLVKTSALEIKAENTPQRAAGEAEDERAGEEGGAGSGSSSGSGAGAGAAAASSLPPIVRGGLTALRWTLKLLEAALAAIEVAVAAATTAAAPSLPLPPADLDTVADATSALHDAVIDLAFEVNGGEGALDGGELDEEDEEEDEEEEGGGGAAAGNGAAEASGPSEALKSAAGAVRGAAAALVEALRASCGPDAALGEALAGVEAAAAALAGEGAGS